MLARRVLHLRLMRRSSLRSLRGTRTNWIALALVAIACGGESSHVGSGTGGSGGVNCVPGAGESCGLAGTGSVGSVGGDGGAGNAGAGGSTGCDFGCDGGFGGDGGFSGGPVTGGFGGCVAGDPNCGIGGDGGFGACGGFGCGGFPTTGGSTSTGGATSGTGGAGVVTGFSDAGNGCSYITYPTSWPNACQLDAACVKLSASAETTDGGFASIPVELEGGPPTQRGVEAPLCDPPSPSKEYLVAFDAYSFGPSATFEITTGRAECTGATLETFSLGDFPSDLATGWRTYCASVPGSRLQSRIGVLADQPGAQTIQNIRVVSSCDCIRDVQYQTTCGMHGHGGSSGCL